MRILNYDETWINRWTFASRAWSRRGVNNVCHSKAVSPRITVVAVVDNFGNQYMAVSQGNTNQHTTQLFLW